MRRSIARPVEAAPPCAPPGQHRAIGTAPLLAVACLGAAACVAPPLGLGAGPQVPSVRAGALEGRAAMGTGASGRQAFQAEGSVAYRPARPFAIELGAALTRISQRTGDEEVSVIGGFPYVRPRLVVRDVSLAVGLAGFGMGGGGGGVVGGVVDAQLAYAARPWGVYAGAVRHAFALTASDGIETSSQQLRFGAQYLHPFGVAHLGVAVELFVHDDRLRDDGADLASRQLGAALRLSITSPELR